MDSIKLIAILKDYLANPPEENDAREFRQSGEGYKHRYWDMVREMKGVSGMAFLPGHVAIPVIEEALLELGAELTALGYDCEEDATDDLESLWDNVKLAMNEAPLQAAVRMTMAHPLEFETERLSTKYQQFLNIGYHLQSMRGDDYISLPVGALSKILGVTPVRVSDYRKYAIADGYLAPFAKATWNPKGTGVATKFHFRWEGMNGANCGRKA